MSQQVMACPKCNNPLKFLRWSNRKPAKSEALAECSNGCGKWQIRYWNGKQTSDPYQVAKTEKPCRGSYRIKKARAAAIVAIWGSVQNFLDNGSVTGLPRMSQQ